MSPSAPSSAPARKIHVQQQHVECALAHPLGQARRIAQRLDEREVALQKKAGGLKDVLVVIDDQDAGGAGGNRNHEVRVSEYEQVSGHLYATEQFQASPPS